MKWAIAEGFLESDPSAAILAGLGKNSTRRNHMRALHHSNVGAAIKSVERSLGNHRRLQNPYSDSNQKRRSPKRHMGREKRPPRSTTTDH